MVAQRLSRNSLWGVVGANEDVGDGELWATESRGSGIRRVARSGAGRRAVSDDVSDDAFFFADGESPSGIIFANFCLNLCSAGSRRKIFLPRSTAE